MIAPIANINAMNAFTTGLHGAAYNVANVNTAGFTPVEVHYQSGRPADLGVFPIVTRPGHDGYLVPTQELESSWAGVPLNRVDLAKEMTNMMLNQRAFEANAAVIRTYDDVAGTLVDMVV